jgi:serine/threonine protein kinase
VVTDLIVGRYEIVEDEGDKRKAIDRLTGRMVVVQSKPLDAPPSEEHLERLVRLRHANLAGFLHYFALNGEMWIVSEFANGSSLEALLSESPVIESEKARAWMLRMAEGAQATHTAGLLVGELSPSKVMIAEDGAVKILDAGLSGLAADEATVQNEVATLAAIFRRMLGEKATAELALGQLDAAQNCSGLLTALKEIVLATPVAQRTADRRPISKRKKTGPFRNWNRRMVIAIVATLIGIIFGYKVATHGQSSQGFITHMFERDR